MPWKNAFFAADGGVFPCCNLTERMGDIGAQDWNEIWNSPLYRSLRRTVHGWNPSHTCRYCPLPTGINGGDAGQYDKFFAKYASRRIDLDPSELNLGGGFYDLEMADDGTPSHIWMGKKASLTLPMIPKARFLRFEIVPRALPVIPFNSGQCRTNGGNPEPFDNTCRHISFPLDGVKGDSIEARFEMDETFRAESDTRDLGLAIKSIHILGVQK